MLGIVQYFIPMSFHPTTTYAEIQRTRLKLAKIDTYCLEQGCRLFYLYSSYGEAQEKSTWLSC
jgi:hypothetical protein